MSEFIREMFLKDFWLKLFSFALAVLTWFTVWFTLEKQGAPVPSLALAPVDKTIYGNIPVTVLSTAEDVRSFHVFPKEVAVTVQGTGKTLRELQPRDIRALVDLTGVSTAENVHKHIEISVPAGVTLVQVEPTEVHVIAPPKTEPKTDTHTQVLSTNSSKH
jgi:YbbR domain-containing protein